jgi:hypothetical protein
MQIRACSSWVGGASLRVCGTSQQICFQWLSKIKYDGRMKARLVAYSLPCHNHPKQKSRRELFDVKNFLSHHQTSRTEEECGDLIFSNVMDWADNELR